MIYICGVLLQILETVGKSPKDHSTYDLYKIHKVKWTPYLEHSVSQTTLAFEQKRVHSLINIEILIHLKRFTTFFVPTNSRQVNGITQTDFRKAQSTLPQTRFKLKKIISFRKLLLLWNTLHRSSRPEVFCKKDVLEILHYPQENTCARVSLIKLQASGCFPVTFPKF